MRIASARMTSKGQITVPATVRKELGLAIGSVVEFDRLPDGKIGIVPKSRSMADIRGIVKTKRVLTNDELTDEIDRAMGGRWARHGESGKAGDDDRS